VIEINKTYLPASKTSCHYRVLGGGAGSGKSVFVAQNILQRAAEQGRRILVVRKTARTLRHSTFQLFLDILSAMKRTSMVRVHKSEMRLDFPSGGAILHAGLDDAEKIKSIAEIDDIWVEEATEISKLDAQLLDLRLRGKGWQQITFTFNPTVLAKWIRTWLAERTDTDSPHAEDVYVQFTTAVDNPWAGDEYIKRLKTLPKDLREVYLKGKWGEALRGLVYPDYTVTDTACEPSFYGLDFGFNNATALVGIQNADTAMRLDEILYESGLTNTDLIRRMETLIKDKSVRIYCDAAEPARIEELSRAGFNAHPADKSVNDGIDTVKRYHLEITRTSQHLLNEVREYRWDENRRTGELLDKPVKNRDHAMDAMRYGIHTELAGAHHTFGLWGQ
jgi:phage terminase large subunit